MGKLINRIPGLRFDIKLLGSASRVCVESLGKPRDSRSILEALPGKIDIKRHSLSILYIPEFFFMHVHYHDYMDLVTRKLDFVACELQRTGPFPAILGKAPGKRWEKKIDLTSKLGEINNIEYYKGSKIYPLNQVILDCTT